MLNIWNIYNKVEKIEIKSFSILYKCENNRNSEIIK